MQTNSEVKKIRGCPQVYVICDKDRYVAFVVLATKCFLKFSYEPVSIAGYIYQLCKICLSPEKADIDIAKLAVSYRKCIYYCKYSMNTCTCVFEKTA